MSKLAFMYYWEVYIKSLLCLAIFSVLTFVCYNPILVKVGGVVACIIHHKAKKCWE